MALWRSGVTWSSGILCLGCWETQQPLVRCGEGHGGFVAPEALRATLRFILELVLRLALDAGT
jgi:hypothetical protein